MRELKVLLVALVLSLALGLGIALTLAGNARASGDCGDPPSGCEGCTTPTFTMGPCCPAGYMEMWVVYYALPIKQGDPHCENLCNETVGQSTYFDGCMPPW